MRQLRFLNVSQTNDLSFSFQKIEISSQYKISFFGNHLAVKTMLSLALDIFNLLAVCMLPGYLCV